MDTLRPDTHQKALSINLDSRRYGTIAEIGAGQEIAGWLFHVGGASGTVAKTMSAYDMQFSDAIYGKSKRYVSKQRLEQMLDHEYDLLIERLAQSRGELTTFFVLANTISARNFEGTNVSHGWLGVRFQSEPGGESNDILIHANLLDPSNLLQQQTVGVLGINLLFAAFNCCNDRDTLLASLFDNLKLEQVEIDYIYVEGPLFRNESSREWGLELLKQGLSHVVMYGPNGELVPPAEAMYKRPIAIQRGSFKRDVDFYEDMLATSELRLKEKYASEKYPPLGIFEITINNLLVRESPSSSALLERVERLQEHHRHVMLTNYPENYHLTRYLNRFTEEPIRFVLGVASLVQVFQEKYYWQLQGGILEALGRLLASNVKMYVYPMPVDDVIRYLSSSDLDLDFWEMPLQGVADLSNVRPEGTLSHLFNYLLEQHAFVAMTTPE
ncbi:MAG: hypothetical protein KDD62_00055 [Bdellovibrionales bacterium]|nr:hypothetical protein [Bdellovibrionales bacterium]